MLCKICQLGDKHEAVWKADIISLKQRNRRGECLPQTHALESLCWAVDIISICQIQQSCGSSPTLGCDEVQIIPVGSEWEILNKYREYLLLQRYNCVSRKQFWKVKREIFSSKQHIKAINQYKHYHYFK